MIIANIELLPSGEIVNLDCVEKNITILPAELSTIDNSKIIGFENAIAFPGLVNSHDHLDFNLFPMLGNPPYHNYTEWGRNIQISCRKEIDAILSIPVQLRVRWGMYKNLLSGVTTVVDHGQQIKIPNPLVKIISNHQSLHSVGFEKYWKLKLNNPLKKNVHCVIHIGEGTDQFSKDEIDALLKWNLLHRPLIGIHGVAMSAEQARGFKGLVWCPASNFFLFDTTADIGALKLNTLVCFGTDSTLTSGWNTWDHIRMAKKTSYADDADLLRMLTENPSNLWGIRNKADLIIARKKVTGDGMQSFSSTNPEDILLILQDGNISLFDNSIVGDITHLGYSPASYTQIFINGTKKYVTGDLKALVEEIWKYSPSIKFPFELPPNKGD